MAKLKFALGIFGSLSYHVIRRYMNLHPTNVLVSYIGCTQKNRNLSKRRILPAMTSNVALIVGVTGIVGIPLAQQLLDKKWNVYGISRRTADYIPSGVKHIRRIMTVE